MKKTATAATILALGSGSLLGAAPATAAPSTPTAVVQVQESRFPSPTKGQRLRSWVCNIAPAICR